MKGLFGAFVAIVAVWAVWLAIDACRESVLDVGLIVADDDRAPVAPARPAEPEEPGVDLTGVVRAAQTYITIENRDSFDWTSVRLTIQHGIFTAYEARLGRIRAGQQVVIDLADFTIGNKRFNPATMAVQMFIVSADTPSGRGYLGVSFR